MAFKLKLNTGKASSPDSSIPPTPASTTSLKLKATPSQPPTPATEQPTQAPAKKTRGGGGQGRGGKAAAGKKRAANDDTISPAPKRPNKLSGPIKRLSLKVQSKPSAADTAPSDDTPSSAADGPGKIPLRRKSTQPVLRNLNVKRPPPPRIPGHGYDSEDSEAEEDPAIQQAFILRMEPGEDCEYLRDAIANGKVGLPSNEGPAEVSLRFIEKDNRRAVVTIRGRMYAAALVDLPCIVESMKSWDRKGWWKVADICQMLLVLGRCTSDDEAKRYPLPREVDHDTLQYPHGLTPPMRWVRKRRFRKRLSYKTIANVEEEVERLLREDAQVEALNPGGVSHSFFDRNGIERSGIADGSQLDEDEEGDAMETVENDGPEYEEYYDEDDNEEDDDMADADLEGNLQAMFDEDHAQEASATPTAVADITQSPRPLADQAASFVAAENAVLGADSPAAAATPASPTSDEDEDDDPSDDDDDDASADSPDVLDEDAAAQAAERNQQLEEVADLEREVDLQRRKVESMKNQLLKERANVQLKNLEEDLRVKKSVLGMGEDALDGEDDEMEDDDEDDGGE